MRNLLLSIVLALTLGTAARAAITVTTTQGEYSNLGATYSATDLIEGQIAKTLPGDNGWHPVNTNPADQLAAFTDGHGPNPDSTIDPYYGLLNDFPAPGTPTKLIQYTVGTPSSPVDLSEIRVFSGNGNTDGRVFQTYIVKVSSDGGTTFSLLDYVQSHPSGTINNTDPASNHWHMVLTDLQSTDGILAKNVTDIEFDFYGVDNSQGQYRDPFDGVNPFTGTDDGLTAPNTSPEIWEIDVFGSPSIPTDAASIGAAKAQVDGTRVNITSDVVVTLVPISETGFFYIQDPDGSSGIRANLPGSYSGSLPNVGDKVLVSGLLGTDADGERVLQGASFTNDGAGGTTPIRIVNNRDVGGTGYASLDGSAQATGLSNQGLLMEVFGKVTYVDFVNSVWYLDDGSGANPQVMDGLGNPITGIKVSDSGVFPNQGDYVGMVGVVTSDIVNGKQVRVIRGREGTIASDFLPLAP